MTGKPRVLFVSYGGGHVAMVAPVARALVESGRADVLVLALTTARAVCNDAGLPTIGFEHLVPAGDVEAVAAGQALVGERAGHANVSLTESYAYHGLSFLDLVDRYGRAEAERRFATEGRAAFLPIGVMRRFLDEHAPDVVVATNAPRAERAAIEAAGQLRIPSACMVDLFGAGSAWIESPGFADRVLVLNDAVRRRYIERGRAPGEVIATGNPAFDDLREVRARRRRRPPHDGLRVLHASQPVGRDGRFGAAEVRAELVRIAGRTPAWEVVIRPHPNESIDDVIPGDGVVIDGATSLRDQLVWCDVVVTTTSTVGLEAALAGVAVVAAGDPATTRAVPYAELGLAHAACRVDDIEAAVLAAHEAGGPESLPAGDATERVATVVLELTSSRA